MALPRSLAGLPLLLLAVACSHSSADPAPVVPPRGPATIYVDANTGDDGNDGLTPSAPLRTLAAATAIMLPAGGDTLVLTGMFREALLIEGVNGANDPARPTVVRAATDGSGTPVLAGIDGGVTPSASSYPYDKRGLPSGFGPGLGNYLNVGIALVNSNHVTLENIVVRGSAGYGIHSSKCSHLTFDGCTVEWTAWSGMLLDNGELFDPFVRDLEIIDCRINQTNQGSWVDEAAQKGFGDATESVSMVRWDGFRVIGNHLSNGMKEGFDFKVGSHNGEVAYNLVENTRAVGIYANEASDVEIHHNVVLRTGWYDPQDGSPCAPVLTAEYLAARETVGWSCGVQVPIEPGLEAGSTGIILSNGDLSPMEAFETGRVSDISVHDNVVAWCRKGSITVNNEWRFEGKTGWVVDNLRIYNNVFFAGCQGPEGAASVTVDHAATNILVANNTITNSARLGFALIGGPGPLPFNGTVTNNLYFANFTGNGLPMIDPMPVLALPEFVQSPGEPGDPSDFSLQPTSPAIGAGTEINWRGVMIGSLDIGAYPFGVPRWMAGQGQGGGN